LKQNAKKWGIQKLQNHKARAIARVFEIPSKSKFLKRKIDFPLF